MLKRFEVTNFKNFNEKFVFDFSETKNYAFNESCVVDGIVKTGMIYGPNGCGKSNLGYAIFDIQTHLTDEKTNPIYRRDYLNAGNSSDIAEFCYTFQFGDFTLEYSYGKFTVDKFAYETVKINGKKVVSFKRNKDTLATILLEGTENLNKKIGDSNLSVVKYIGRNSIFNNNITNMVFESLLIFVDHMSLFQPINMQNYIARFPDENWLSNIVKKESGYTLKQFEKFINKAGVPCKLAIVKSLDEDRLVFDFGNKKIDFLSNASSGTQVLTFLYIDLIFLRLRIKSTIADNKIHELQIENLELNDEIQGTDSSTILLKPFVFVDEFDAFYHHNLSQQVVKEFRDLDTQAILTTHNTSIMTNDLLRPDCYFTMNENSIKPLYQNTIKDLRKAHSLEKMYRAGAFSE